MQDAHDDVEQRVITIVAAALDCRPSEIDPSAPLRDLGAESLDFLDVAFRLEREFRVRMPRLNVLQRAEEHFGAATLVRDGLLTDFGLDVLRQTMPEVDPALLQPGLRASEVGHLLSAATFVRVVRRMLAARQEMPGACPDCGGTLSEPSAALEVVCDRCGRTELLPGGDDVLLRDLMALAR